MTPDNEDIIDTRIRRIANTQVSARIHVVTDLREAYSAPAWLHAEMMAEERRYNEVRRVK